jgi:transcriptional regulator with XRE-family HTH domain
LSADDSFVTLRRVLERGWSAKGLLEPLWQRVGGRDELARLTGISGSTLSGYNSGKRPLGMANAHKIAAVLGVSLYDLGAREPHSSDFARSLLGQTVEQLRRHPPHDPDLLEELADELAGLAEGLRQVAASQRAGGPVAQ